MTDGNDDYVYDEVTGEWGPAAALTGAAEARAVRVVDASGTVLADHYLRHRGQTGREGAVGFERN